MTGNEFTTKDVRQFITSILLVGNILKVDTQGAVYWKGAEEDEPVILELAGGGKGTVFTFTTTANKPDAIIVNPFAENITLSADRNWFYKVTSTIFSGSLIRAMDSLLRMALSESDCAYPELVSYITPIVGKVDEKMLTEFKYIADVGANDFCTLAYHTKAKETRMFLGIEDPTGDFQKSIPTSKVRKKSWEVFQTLLKSIFGTQGPVAEEMKNSTCLITCPQFRTYMDVWLRGWKSIAPILTSVEADDHEDLPVLLASIEEHLDRIDVYHKMCLWCSQSSPVAAVKSAVKKIDAPAPAAALPSNAPVHQPTQAPAVAPPEQPAGSRWNTPQQPQMPQYQQPQYQPVAPTGPGSRWSTPSGGFPCHQQPIQPHGQTYGARNAFGDPNYNQVFGRPQEMGRPMYSQTPVSPLNPHNQ